MSLDIVKTFALGVLLMLVQVLVFNNIHLFGCATPLLFVYLILLAPTSAPRWLVLVISFVIGLISDIFSNTPGVGAASMTLIGFIQPNILHLFLTKENEEDLHPSLHTLGISKYMSYSIILVLIFCFTFFTLEEFAFFHWQQWLMYIVGSTVITYILILTIEFVRKG